VTKIIATKCIGRRIDGTGAVHETHHVELDGLSVIELEVVIPKNVDRLRDPVRRAERVRSVVVKAAQAQIDAAVADHAG
jgi:hypothetical protein